MDKEAFEVWYMLCKLNVRKGNSGRARVAAKCCIRAYRRSKLYGREG